MMPVMVKEADLNRIEVPEDYEVLDAGYNGKGKGKDWVEKDLGLTTQVVRRPRRPRYVWVKEGEEIDWERIRKLLPEPGFKVLPRRWVVERTFSWID